MGIKTKTRTIQILRIMRIIAWVAFIGFSIEVGAILATYCISYFNPDAASNLYRGLDLYNLRQFNFWYYTQSVVLMMAISAMKAYVAFLTIKILRKVNLKNPFKIEVVRILERVSYILFGIWIVAILNALHNEELMKNFGVIQNDLNGGEFIFIAGIVFVFSQIFKRGVEIQAENELTV